MITVHHKAHKARLVGKENALSIDSASFSYLSGRHFGIDVLKKEKDPGENSGRRRARADFQAQLAAANAARKIGDWKTASAHLAAAVVARPDDHYLRMKQARALVQSGELERALNAYRQAVILKPERPEGHLELGRTLRQLGQREKALSALARAVALSRIYPDARRELILAGGISQVPVDEGAKDPGADRFAVETYAAFRRHCPVLPPPEDPEPRPHLFILVDGVGDEPAAVRATLLSLLEQRHADWSARVILSSEKDAHPVRSLAHTDSRIAFRPDGLLADDADFAGWAVSLSAGTVLDPEALAWMAHAATLSPTAAFCDHEIVATDWKGGRRALRPALQPMPDPYDLASTPEPPLMVLLPRHALAALLTAAGQVGFADARRSYLRQVATTGEIGHIARILAARQESSPVTAAPETTPTQAQVTGELVGDLTVIIPTRDSGDLLKTCLDSLREKTTYPDRVRYLVIDNGSRDAMTMGLLGRFGRTRNIEVLRVDEPFNWSRLNNLAVKACQSRELVFVNNDTEMLSNGWDVRLSSRLARVDVGIVGARLLYPDGAVQHAGLALGVADGMPIHEGVHAEAGDGGPLGRWRRARSAAAVTGAFMGIRRETFEAAGGFDDINLAVAYNDVDLCLRVRELGLSVLYEPALELIHHESVSRGRNDSKAKIAWDHGELGSLHERWGDALFQDPGRNPQWATDRMAPFDGFRNLSSEEAARHISASMQQPWKTARRPERS